MSSIKRYLVFSGSDCYPLGGMNDLSANNDLLSKAVSDAFRCIRKEDWCTVYDTESMSELFTLKQGWAEMSKCCVYINDELALRYEDKEGTCSIIQTY